MVTQGFKPVVTPEGLAHPVTRIWPAPTRQCGRRAGAAGSALIGAQKISGTTLMTGPNGQPLLVLDRVKQGPRGANCCRIRSGCGRAASKAAARRPNLLRRLAHWLMKEPDLEEERLQAEVANGELTIARRTMAAEAAPVKVTAPSGHTDTVTLTPAGAGLFSGQLKTTELGLYHLTDGTLNAIAAAGPLNPREVADMRATDSILKPFAAKTGGAVNWLKDGLPAIREVEQGRDAHGDGWIGLTRRKAYRVSNVEQEALLPPWLALVLLLGTILIAWRVEGR